MRERVREIISQGDALFSKVFPLHSLWQTLAENFHVMRADFTRLRFFSEEFASYLMTSRPAMAHRDLSNAIPALMRPRGQQWLYARTHDDKINNDREARAYLDWMSERLFKEMYAKNSGFVRATKEGDGDYSAFGNAVFTVEQNQMRNGLLFNCWHLRDVVWSEGSDRKIDEVHHRRKITIRELCRMFPKTCHPTVTSNLSKEPNKEINVRRFVIPSNEYDFEKPLRNGGRFPFVSVYVDVDNEKILEESPQRVFTYRIPRWVTISGSQYAYSPATVLGLPDARMLQQMALTIMEAGQKATDPPLKAVAEAITGGVNTGAGMITWTDPDYDERTGPVLEHLIANYDGVQWGAQREEKVEGALDATFFLNQIRLPQITKEMTAFEASKLYEEFQRNSMPLLEPIEVEYNGGLCDGALEQTLAMGMYGRPQDMPEVLQDYANSGEELRWEFDTPLKQAAEQKKVFTFSQAVDIAAKGMQVDPKVALNVDWGKASRDAFMGAGAADWLVDEAQVKKMARQQAQQEQAAQVAQQMANGGDAASKVANAGEAAGNASKALQEAGMQ